MAESPEPAASSAPSASVAPIGTAATVVLLRDATDGVEVLLLERPHDRGSFRGAWVFPGGSVDPEDDGDVRRAAVRETREETGLPLDPAALVAVSVWRPPIEAPKRLTTSFFLAAAPQGGITLEPAESVAWAWLRPAEALERHAAGALTLFPPTWVTLHGLGGAASVADALADARERGSEEFSTRFTADRSVALWQTDAAYADDARLGEPGARHRLTVAALPWVYERTADVR